MRVALILDTYRNSSLHTSEKMLPRGRPRPWSRCMDLQLDVFTYYILLHIMQTSTERRRIHFLRMEQNVCPSAKLETRLVGQQQPWARSDAVLWRFMRYWRRFT